MALPRHVAGMVAGLAGAAYVGPVGVDRAGRRNADLTYEGQAAHAIATHARKLVIDQLGGNPVQRGVVLNGEARPFVGVSAARPAHRAGGGVSALHHGGGAQNSAIFLLFHRDVGCRSRLAVRPPEL